MILKLKEIREQHGLKQDNVAEYLKISRPAYSRYETGERNPSIETLIKIADFYKISLDNLVGRMPIINKIDFEISKLSEEEKDRAADMIKAAFNKKED